MTRDEVAKKMMALLDNAESVDVATGDEPGSYTITVSAEGSGHDGYTYEHLAALAEMFQTRKVDIGLERDSGGCETCGHGASHILYFRVREAKVVLDV